MSRDPEVIRTELEETRERMGETIEVLGEKADVRTRTREKLAERADALRARIGGGETGGGGSPTLVQLAIGGAAAGFVLGMLLPSDRGYG
jgi:hypothetical protein